MAVFSLFASIGVAAPPSKPLSAPTFGARLIVKLKPPAHAQGLSAQQIQHLQREPMSAQLVRALSTDAAVPLSYVRASALGTHVLQLPNALTPTQVTKAIEGIRKRGDIAYVEEDKRMYPTSSVNDPHYTDGSLWGMNALYGANFANAWTRSTGQNVVVAVLDTGIVPHPDLVGPDHAAQSTLGSGPGSNLISSGYDFITDCTIRNTCLFTMPPSNSYVPPSPGAMDLGNWVTVSEAIFSYPYCEVKESNWHGTHVAGTVAAIGNNSIGVVGGAFNAKILPVRVLGKCGGNTSDVVEGLLWAAGLHETISNSNPAQVINMSLGGYGQSCSQIFQEAINKVVTEAEATIVVSAGNSDAPVQWASPANCNNVITVAATGPTGARSWYSNHDNGTTIVALAAPGGDHSIKGIFSTASSSTQAFQEGSANYLEYQGTSMAAPHVSAAVALMLSVNPELTPANVRAVLTSPASVTVFPTGTVRDCGQQCGSGILNAARAVQNAAPLLETSESPNFYTKPVGSESDLQVSFSNRGLVPSAQGKASLSGPGASAYSIVNNTCDNATVAVNGSCALTIRFAPTSTGSYVATLSIPAQSGGATTVAVNGWAGSKLSVDATSKVVEPLTVGQTTHVQVVFTNISSAILTMAAPSITHPAMAISADTCSGVALGVGANCSVTVAVSPAAEGELSGILSLNSTGTGDIAQQVTVSGTAVAAPPAPVGGGGGCTMLPPGMRPDISLAFYAFLAMLLVTVRAIRRRVGLLGRAERELRTGC